MSPKVLVTGAKGHTGSFLVRLLVEKGCEVVATDLPPKERAELMTKETVFRRDLKYLDIEQIPGVKFIPADLTNKESLRPLFKGQKYDVIYHPASLYDYFALLDILRKINVGGLKNLLEVIHEECKPFPRFMHWSTCGVYGEPEYERDKRTKELIPADETAPYDPPNFYSISKREQEELLKELAGQWNIPYTIIRPAPIYGPYQMYGAFHIFMILNKLGHMIRPYIIPKSKRRMMPMIHVESLVDAAWFLSQRTDTIGQAYNVIEDPIEQGTWIEYTCSIMGMTWTTIPVWWPMYKFAAKFLFWWNARENTKARKWGIRPKFDISMADYISHQYYFSNDKIKKLGFKFKYTPLEGTLQTLRWYKDHGWLESEEYHLTTPPKEGTE